MNYRVLGVTALLVLAGCTSANEMLKKDPVFYGHTSKTPKEYSTCVADAWRNSHENVKVQAVENGYDVLASGFNGLSAVLRVQQWANGSVEIRMSARSSYGSQDMTQGANLCM